MTRSLRKLVTVAAFAGIFSAAAALDLGMSAGVMAYYTGQGMSGVFGANTDYSMPTGSTANPVHNGILDIEMPWGGGGFGFFFDATYAEAALGFTFGSGTRTYNESRGRPMSSNSWLEEYRREDTNDFSISAVNFSILGKYPFKIGGKIRLFPLLGIDYMAVTSGKITLVDTIPVPTDNGIRETIVKTKLDWALYDLIEPMPKAGDCGALRYVLGAGVDFDLPHNLYVRAQLLGHIRFGNKAEDKYLDVLESTNRTPGEPNKGVAAGTDIRLGVGYKIR